MTGITFALTHRCSQIYQSKGDDPMSNEPILIVDDNPMNLKLERVILEVEKYQVKTARNAEETIQVLHDFHPRLILMDLGLPGLDGVELTKQLKADLKNKDIIILMATS